MLPVDRGIEFEMESADVIHSLWIPEMGQKQDVVPGVTQRIVITPTRTGSFTLICTELCGLGHATMRAPVRVLEQEAFAQWLEQQSAERRTVRAGGAAGAQERGAEVFATAGCGGCHALAKAGTDAEIGPPLDDLAAAAQEAGVPVAEFVRSSIVDPDAVIAPDYQPGVMPKDFGESLTPDELDALVGYLSGEDSGDDDHGPPRRGDSAWSRPAAASAGHLVRPGYVRAAWCAALFFLVGMYIVVTLRWLAGWDPVYDWEIIVLVGGMVTAPLGFLLGLGAFDYWLYWLSGRPTVADDHANHGAYRWTDCFKVNTDHKVIGVQYLVTTFFFFIVGGFLAMLFRAELAQPGMQFFDTQTFNGLVSAHATFMIFVFIIPAFAGLADFAVPLMLGAPDMAFPRLNALSFWMLPVAGMLFLASFLAPGGAFATGWTSYAPLASEQPFGQVFFNMGVQWAGASSIATALNFLVTIITMRAPGDVLAHAAARLGELHDVTARRDRDAVHRRLAVLRHVRPGDAHELLHPGQRRVRARLPASSGSTATRPSTS